MKLIENPYSIKSKPFPGIIFVLAMLLLLPSSSIFGQFLKSKIVINAGYDYNFKPGEEIITEGNFSFPSFYSNMKKKNGFHLEGAYNFHKIFSAGLNYSMESYKNWNYFDYPVYNDSECLLHLFSPFLRIQYKPRNATFLSHLTGYIDLFPSIGISDIMAEKATIYQNMALKDTHIKDVIWGYGCKIGMMISLNNYCGLAASYTISDYNSNTRLIADSSFKVETFNVGFCCFLMWDKDIYIY
jgi:hypothetical protein